MEVERTRGERAGRRDKSCAFVVWVPVVTDAGGRDYGVTFSGEDEWVRESEESTSMIQSQREGRGGGACSLTTINSPHLTCHACTVLSLSPIRSSRYSPSSSHQAYHSTFNELTDVRVVGNTSVLPIKSRFRGPAPIGSASPDPPLVSTYRSSD
jgi:hypothetical protein